MLSHMAHSTYLYCSIDVIHNDFKLADQKTRFCYGHEFMIVVIFNNAPQRLNLNTILNSLTLLNKGMRPGLYRGETQLLRRVPHT